MRDTNRVIITNLTTDKATYIKELKYMGFREVYYKHSDKGDNIDIRLNEQTFGFISYNDIPKPWECNFMSLEVLKRKITSQTQYNDDRAILKEDKVNHPNHYNYYSIETIEAIKGQMTKEEFLGYCKGNVFKYVARYQFKNGVEDLNKAEWYLKQMIEVLNNA